MGGAYAVEEVAGEQDGVEDLVELGAALQLVGSQQDGVDGRLEPLQRLLELFLHQQRLHPEFVAETRVTQ